MGTAIKMKIAYLFFQHFKLRYFCKHGLITVFARPNLKKIIPEIFDGKNIGSKKMGNQSDLVRRSDQVQNMAPFTGSNIMSRRSM